MERNPKFITLLHFLLGDEFDSYMASQGAPVKISPLDILGFRRDHPDLFYEHLLNRKKHKPMKKYRVVTDNLDWFKLKLNDTITYLENRTVEVRSGRNDTLIKWLPHDDLYIQILEDCIRVHPEWFSEIKENEQPRQFNLKDMIEFGRFVYGQTKPSTIPIDMTLLDKWIQKAHPEDCVTKTKDSQKEETKEFTRKDMCMFASYAHCYHSEKISYNAQLSEWESYYHNK